ncbi:YbjN domain-containing protein [Magnetospirillum fulvum]|uniref:Putative sensory transduction regulator n=1 Tax=Magnetospirillum fulvum TaxID=1082 RepID=A0A1H6JU07_MAGFU|nr:YbjN domain-containing protein [Magnetospirillum fulvum]SEH66014.1 Putative sensory transduction regulator [Magnetospirillum fulvum]
MTDISRPTSPLSLETARDALQAAGYRVEEIAGPTGDPALRSATGGLAFTLMVFNPRADQPGTFADAAFQTAFQVEGDLPLALVNQWNATVRFARLHLQANLLRLDRDIVAFDGITPAALRAEVELWDRLVQHLIAFLREELPKLTASPSEDDSKAA